MNILSKISAIIIMIVVLAFSVAYAAKKFMDYDQKTTPALTDVVLISANGAGTYYMTFEDLFDDTSLFGNNTVTTAEFQYLGDVTGLLQAQMDLKAALASPTFTTSITIGTNVITEAEAGYLEDVTSSVQDQLDARALESVVGTSLNADDLELDAGVLQTATEIPHVDAVEAISGNWEVQDGIHLSFGNDDDSSFAWDAAAVRLELRDVSDAPIFWFDLANSSFNVASTASPKSGLYDSGATGTDRTDEYAGGIGANITDGTEDAVVSDVFIYYMDTTEKAALTVDGSADEISTALQFVTTGDIMGGINVSSKAGAYTVGTDDAHEAYGTLFINSNVADLTLPATPAVGMNGCLMQAAGVTGIMKLQPEGDENLVYQGVEMTAGTDLASAGAATDRICWVAITTDHWLITSSVGTWAE